MKRIAWRRKKPAPERPPTPEPPPRRALVVRLSALGDIVHALPVAAALRRRWPEVEVDWLVDAAYAPILSIADGLHRRIVVHAAGGNAEAEGAVSFGGRLGVLRAIRYLRRQRYDIALDLQGLIKSAVWARLSGAKRVVGFDREHLRERRASMFYTEAVAPYRARHVIQKNLAMASALGAQATPVELPLRPVESSAMTEVITRAGGPRGYVVINPGAAWPNKRWPAERFGELAAAIRERTGLHSLVTWGPAEHDLADAVCRASSGAAHAAPPTTIADLAMLMRDAALVISGDTGPLHIAAAMGAPLVGLYGPTSSERNGSWHPDDEVLSRADACACKYKRRCLRGRPCIDEIALAEVLAAAERRLAKARAV